MAPSASNVGVAEERPRRAGLPPGPLASLEREDAEIGVRRVGVLDEQDGAPALVHRWIGLCAGARREARGRARPVGTPPVEVRRPAFVRGVDDALAVRSPGWKSVVGGVERELCHAVRTSSRRRQSDRGCRRPPARRSDRHRARNADCPTTLGLILSALVLPSTDIQYSRLSTPAVLPGTYASVPSEPMEYCAPPVPARRQDLVDDRRRRRRLFEPIEIEAHAVERPGVDVKQVPRRHVMGVVTALQHDLAGHARIALDADRAVVPSGHIDVSRVEELSVRQDGGPAVRGFVRAERERALGLDAGGGDPGERRLRHQARLKGDVAIRGPRGATSGSRIGERGDRAPRQLASSSAPWRRRIQPGCRRVRRRDWSRPRCPGARSPGARRGAARKASPCCRCAPATRSCAHRATARRLDQRQPRAIPGRRCC